MRRQAAPGSRGAAQLSSSAATCTHPAARQRPVQHGHSGVERGRLMRTVSSRLRPGYAARPRRRGSSPAPDAALARPWACRSSRRCRSCRRDGRAAAAGAVAVGQAGSGQAGDLCRGRPGRRARPAAPGWPRLGPPASAVVVEHAHRSGSRRACSRSAGPGTAGRRGRYAAPAFSTASSAVTRPADRSSMIPTTDSGRRTACRQEPRQPVRRLRQARCRSAHASPHTTATASGVAATCAANSSGTVAAGTGAAVSFHWREDQVAARRRRAPGPGAPAARGSAATAVSTRSNHVRDPFRRARVEQVGGGVHRAPASPAGDGRRQSSSSTMKFRSNLAG